MKFYKVDMTARQTSVVPLATLSARTSEWQLVREFADNLNNDNVTPEDEEQAAHKLAATLRDENLLHCVRVVRFTFNYEKREWKRDVVYVSQRVGFPDKRKRAA